MTRIKAIRTASNISQSALADILNVKQNTISSWESGRTEPDFESMRKISEIFEVSVDFILSAGVFENWDMIINHPFMVYQELQRKIPPGFEMPTNMHSDRLLLADLDIWLNYDPNELLLARWFQFAVKSVQFEPESTPETAHIEFTPEFDALISQSNIKKAPSYEDAGLSAEEAEVLRLFRAAPTALQDAAIRVLEAHQKAKE